MAASEPPGLPMWTIYAHPLDHPDHFVVRSYTVVRDGRDGPERDSKIALADSLEEARKLVPPGLYCMTRSPLDEPQIVETWF